MRRSDASFGGLDEFPTFPISPILVHYGGQPMADGYGWTAYRCPFHGDSDASGSVNTTEQLFNCHAADCPKGSATQIIMKAENVSYAEAVERAATITGTSDPSVQRASRRSQRMAGGTRSGRGGRTLKSVRGGRRSDPGS